MKTVTIPEAEETLGALLDLVRPNALLHFD